MKTTLRLLVLFAAFGIGLNSANLPAPPTPIPGVHVANLPAPPTPIPGAQAV